MYSAVTHLTLNRPLDEDLVLRLQDELMVQAGAVEGFVAAYCLKPAEDELALVVLTRTAEAMDAVHDLVEAPWLTDNLDPYVDTAVRRPGPVIAQS